MTTFWVMIGLGGVFVVLSVLRQAARDRTGSIVFALASGVSAAAAAAWLGFYPGHDTYYLGVLQNHNTLGSAKLTATMISYRSAAGNLRDSDSPTLYARVEAPRSGKGCAIQRKDVTVTVRGIDAKGPEENDLARTRCIFGWEYTVYPKAGAHDILVEFAIHFAGHNTIKAPVRLAITVTHVQQSPTPAEILGAVTAVLVALLSLAVSCFRLRS